MRAAPTSSLFGYLLEMWRAKIQKWYSNRLSIYSSYFQIATVTFHKALYSIKKLYPAHCLIFLFSFSFPQSSLSPLSFFPSLFSSPLSSLLCWSSRQLLLASSPSSLLNSPSHLHFHLPLKKTHLHKPISWPFHQNPTGTHCFSVLGLGFLRRSQPGLGCLRWSRPSGFCAILSLGLRWWSRGSSVFGTRWFWVDFTVCWFELLCVDFACTVVGNLIGAEDFGFGYE